MTSPDSWPHGVSSLNDHKRFMKLMFGQEGTDLTEQIPWHKWVGIDDPRKTCFLGFVRNFRTSGRLEEIRDCFGIFDEQMDWEANNGAYFQNAHQMHNVQGSGHRPYYLCAFINGNNCLCNVSFEGSKKWDKCSCSRTANAFPSGRKFEALLTETLKSNWKNCFDDDNSVASAPHWLRDGTYHTLFNKYTHAMGQGISFHRDSAITYSELDPITSFTLCSPGVLLVKIASDEKRVTSKTAKRYIKCLLIFQEEWDAVVMSGQFQKVLVHCVPERTKWFEILETKACKDESEVQWEIANAVDHDPHWAKFQEYCQRLENDPELAGSLHAVRHNVTIRWHRNHLIDSQCPFAKVKVPGPLSQSAAAVAVPWTTYPPGYSSSQPSTQAASSGSRSSVEIQSATIVPGQTVHFVPPGRPKAVPRWKATAAAAEDSAPVAEDSAPVAEDSVGAAAVAEDSAPVAEDSVSPAANDVHMLDMSTVEPEPAVESSGNRLLWNLLNSAVNGRVQDSSPKFVASNLWMHRMCPDPQEMRNQMAFCQQLLERVRGVQTFARKLADDFDSLSVDRLDVNDRLPSDQWLTDLNLSTQIVQAKMATLTQLKELGLNFLSESGHENFQNCFASNKGIRRCIVTHQHFKEILRVNGFIDLETTEQRGFLILNLTREDSEHIRLSEVTRPCSQFDHEKRVEGRVVLEGLELSLVDADDDDNGLEIPGGTRRLTVHSEKILGIIVAKNSALTPEKLGNLVVHYLISVMDLVERMQRSHKTTANPVISIWLSAKEKRLAFSVASKKLKTTK